MYTYVCVCVCERRLWRAGAGKAVARIMALEVGQVVSLGNPPFLRFGLAWDVSGDTAPDLDASAVAFDLSGNGGCALLTPTHPSTVCPHAYTHTHTYAP